MGKINREWHEQNRMVKNPTGDQRIKWHLEHSRNCSCRGIPTGVLNLMIKKGIEPPNNNEGK